MGLQALIILSYVATVQTIKYKLINCSWTVIGWMAAVGKGPHLAQKNHPTEFSAWVTVAERQNHD